MNGRPNRHVKIQCSNTDVNNCLVLSKSLNGTDILCFEPKTVKHTISLSPTNRLASEEKTKQLRTKDGGP